MAVTGTHRSRAWNWLWLLACLATGSVVRAGLVFDLSAETDDRQITSRGPGHILANAAIWSPDSQWIAYDLRAAGQVFDASRIERVNVITKEVRLIYAATEGAHGGVVTWHPREDRVVFILGPKRPDPNWSYAFSRRQGWLVDLGGDPEGAPLDAMNYAPPFTEGALRGGSHVHMFSPEGDCVSFTYDDEVLERQSANPAAQRNQRNIGVAVLGRPVRVNANHPRNHGGQAFSVLVTQTVDQPEPGSDQISRAQEEGWVGRRGYQRADGRWQARALAFQGTVTAAEGSEHAEVFIVDLPEDLTQAGSLPLAGTELSRPAPPAGTVQRRLTFTDRRNFPGVQGPRHWLRSSPEGSHIAFLMKDDRGIVQLWTVAPTGGEPVQITTNAWSVDTTFTWSPDGQYLAYGMDGSVWLMEVASGKNFRLTQKTRGAPHRSAVVFSQDGRRIGFLRDRADGAESTLQIWVVDVPDRLLSPEGSVAGREP